MPKNDFDTRVVMVLQNEVTRMTQCAERVRLVVQAMAQRRGLQPLKREVDLNFDFGA